MQVNNFLEKSAQKYPDKPAVWFDKKWMTYSEIDIYANKVGNYLKRAGVQKGDRVALLFENSFDHIISYFAILKAGGIAVALNTDITTESLIYLLNHSDAKVIITNKRYSRYVIPALTKTPYLTEVIVNQSDLSKYKLIGHCNPVNLDEIYSNENNSRPDVRCIDIDLEAIVYTSGSTGKPKGVTHTHLNVVSNMRSIVKYLYLTEHDRIMVILPFYYIYGKSLLLTHFLQGGSVVIDNSFAYPNVVLENMKKTDATGFAGVPSTFMILLNKSSLKKYSFPTLRYVTQAGGAMAPNIQKQVHKAFAPAKVFIMYGATEAAPRLSYLDPEILPKKWGSIGKAVPNVDLFVADETGIELPQGEIGELVARGSNIMTGYWKDPEGTKEVLKNGLYYTGDLGKMDEDSYLFVAGRTKDIIKVGGFRVSAKEIEEAILEMHEVHEVAVIGTDDNILGEAIIAYIVPRDDSLNEKRIFKYLQKRLPSYKQPKYYVFRKNLPKNESGKIMKTILKKEENK